MVRRIMAIEQEMAEIYAPEGEDLLSYLPDIDCGKCGYKTCLEFGEAVLVQHANPHRCPDLGPKTAATIAAVAALKKDPILYNVMMEQVDIQLIEIHKPPPTAPLLVTCNFQETVRILTEILETTGTQAFLLPIYTHGYSVDNAVHEKMFKAIEVLKALDRSEAASLVDRPVLIIPGLAASEKKTIQQFTGWEVIVGPESGFMVPLFVRDGL